MRPVPAVLVLTLACTVWAVPAGAQPPAAAAPPQVDVRQLGPRIGEAVPAFQLVDETVPVFKTPFRLVRDVLFRKLPQAAAGGSAAALSVTVTGRLDYQACDDRVCFNPVSVPLSWTFAVGALDRERSAVGRVPEP